MSLLMAAIARVKKELSLRRSGFGGHFSHPAGKRRNRLPVETVACNVLLTGRSMTPGLRRRFFARLPSIELRTRTAQ
jgi:hypothetical protein